jgi:hypothetical protein
MDGSTALVAPGLRGGMFLDVRCVIIVTIIAYAPTATDVINPTAIPPYAPDVTYAPPSAVVEAGPGGWMSKGTYWSV